MEVALARRNRRRTRDQTLERDWRCGNSQPAIYGGEPLLRRDFFQVLKKANTAPFKRIIVQTNGLLLKKLHKEINDSPITNIAVSLDGLKESNDHIRGIQSYFDLGIEGIKLLRGKRVAISVTPNRISAAELGALADMANGIGAHVEINILSRSLFFLKDADLASLWPDRSEVVEIAKFVRDKLRRPDYEVDYITRYYNNEPLDEPACVLGYLQVFVLSNGDVLTGCYPLKPVGNILRDSLQNILASEAYVRQAEAMIRRECPGCTCGVESSLAMKHAAASAMFELSRLTRPVDGSRKAAPVVAAYLDETSHPWVWQATQEKCKSQIADFASATPGRKGESSNFQSSLEVIRIRRNSLKTNGRCRF